MANIGNILKIRLHGFYYLLLQFRKNCAGVAAIEFAFIGPVMILLYIGSMELSMAVSTSRKISRVASTVGDLVTQSTILDGDEIMDIMKVSSEMMAPYNDTVKIRVSGIRVKQKTGRVAWSCSSDEWTKLPKRRRFKVPEDIRNKGDFLVVAQVEARYNPVLGWIGYDSSSGINLKKSGITMSRKIFLRPRVNGIVKVKSC